MRALYAGQAAALAAGQVAYRDFMYVFARDLDTGLPVEFGFWSGSGTFTADVEDGDGAGVVSRAFLGGGAFIEADAVPAVTGLVVQTVSIVMSQVAPGGVTMVRGYDLRRARVDIYRGIFAPATLSQVGPALCRFTGLVDEVEIDTPEEGGDGRISLSCIQHSQELRRASVATRSDADQRRRASPDNFFRHAATCHTWDIKIGSK